MMSGPITNTVERSYDRRMANWRESIFIFTITVRVLSKKLECREETTQQMNIGKTIFIMREKSVC